MTNVPCHTAKCYSHLVEEKTVYTFTIGRKKKNKKLVIDFTNSEFFHLAGIQHINDVEFPTPKTEDNFLLIRDDITFQEKILASKQYPNIIERITHLEHLDWLLMKPDDTVVWEQSRANFKTDLRTDYLFSRTHDSLYDFFGIKKIADGSYKGNTFFVETSKKYINGQTKWTVLKIERSTENSSETLFVHPRFNEDKVNQDNS